MSSAAIAVAAGVSWFVIVIAALMYAEQIKVHRIDIGRHDSPYAGKSAWLEGNVMNSRNYDAAGQRKVRRLKLLSWAQLVPASILLYLFLARTWA